MNNAYGKGRRGADYYLLGILWAPVKVRLVHNGEIVIYDVNVKDLKLISVRN